MESTVKYDPAIFEIEGTVLKKYTGSGKFAEIPEGVTEIGESAFAHNYVIEEVRIPETVTKIGTLAFVHCHMLQGIIIPKSVKEMGDSIFYRCARLKRVTIYGEIEKIGIETFECCHSLTSITLPMTLKEICSTAFCNCSELKKITLPSGLEIIRKSAFLHSGLVSLFIPASVITIEERAFGMCADLAHVSCEAKSKPEGWHGEWICGPLWKNTKNKVLWGCKRKK